MDQDQPDPPYLQFIDPAHGIRAIAKTLQAYEDVHGIHTLEGVFQRWAPSGDNNPTSAYAANVAAALGVAVTDPVDLHDPNILAAITTAIVRQENGTNGGQPWYDEATVKAGVALAFPAEA